MNQTKKAEDMIIQKINIVDSAIIPYNPTREGAISLPPDLPDIDSISTSDLLLAEQINGSKLKAPLLVFKGADIPSQRKKLLIEVIKRVFLSIITLGIYYLFCFKTIHSQCSSLIKIWNAKTSYYQFLPHQSTSCSLNRKDKKLQLIQNIAYLYFSKTNTDENVQALLNQINRECGVTV